MKLILLPPVEYENVKQSIIERIKAWEIAIKIYEEKYNKDYFNKTDLLHAWYKAFKRINVFLSSKNKIDCFIITDDSDELQGIAFGAKRNHGSTTDLFTLFGASKIPSYHIHDILAAPWNILSRAFKKTDETLNDRHKKIGTSLMKLIITHAMTQDVEHIVADIEAPYDSGPFFSKCFFNQITPSLGLTYQLSNKEFAKVVNELPVNKEDTYIIKYSNFNIIDDHFSSLKSPVNNK